MQRIQPKRRQLLIAAATIPAAALPMSAAFAHHGWSSFDETKPLYFVGKVKSAKWENPHAEVVITFDANPALPADLAKMTPPKQTNTFDGAKVLATTALPKNRGEWRLELAPLTRIEAWKVAKPNAGDSVAGIGYTYKEEKGDRVARIEYWMVGGKLYGLRSMPA
jgi:hypothetical protein